MSTLSQPRSSWHGDCSMNVTVDRETSNKEAVEDDYSGYNDDDGDDDDDDGNADDLKSRLLFF